MQLTITSRKLLAVLMLGSASAWGVLLQTGSSSAGSERWLAVAGLSGKVSITLANQRNRLATKGDRLRRIGDRLRTEKNASATLYFDDGIGVLNVSELTTVAIASLTGDRGGKQTRLAVTGGQVKFTIRKFTSPSSRLEVVTPAGIAAVRGTRFGTAVNGRGLTAVATENGRVVASAQGKAIAVPAGFESLIAPGKPPSALASLPEYARLYDVRFERAGPGQVTLQARTDPGNLVRVGEIVVDSDLDGRFSTRVDLSADRLVPVQVTTPLGSTRLFNLTVLPEVVSF